MAAKPLWPAAGVVLCAAAARAQVLWENGPLLTSPNTCMQVPPGSGSERQLINADIGYGMQATAGVRLTDDFQIPAQSGGWSITAIVVLGYQTDPTPPPPPPPATITSVNLRIWSGRPGDPNASVVFGDTITNRLDVATFSSVYRITPSGAGCGTARPVFVLRCPVTGLTLGPGTYWLDWQAAGAMALSGPWSPPVTITGLLGKPGANARQFDPSLAEWEGVQDSISTVPQDLPFQIEGTELGGCYANCDLSTVPPVLTVADFACFLNRFSSGDLYANCDGSTTPPVINVLDFACFTNRFSSGCS